jgi:hypothetical protein
VHDLDPEHRHPLGDGIQETRIVIGVGGYTTSLRPESLDESSGQTSVSGR